MTSHKAILAMSPAEQVRVLQAMLWQSDVTDYLKWTEEEFSTAANKFILRDGQWQYNPDREQLSYKSWNNLPDSDSEDDHADVDFGDMNIDFGDIDVGPDENFQDATQDANMEGTSQPRRKNRAQEKRKVFNANRDKVMAMLITCSGHVLSERCSNCYESLPGDYVWCLDAGCERLNQALCHTCDRKLHQFRPGHRRRCRHHRLQAQEGVDDDGNHVNVHCYLHPNRSCPSCDCPDLIVEPHPSGRSLYYVDLSGALQGSLGVGRCSLLEHASKSSDGRLDLLSRRRGGARDSRKL